MPAVPRWVLIVAVSIVVVGAGVTAVIWGTRAPDCHVSTDCGAFEACVTVTGTPVERWDGRGWCIPTRELQREHAFPDLPESL